MTETTDQHVKPVGVLDKVEPKIDSLGLLKEGRVSAPAPAGSPKSVELNTADLYTKKSPIILADAGSAACAPPAEASTVPGVKVLCDTGSGYQFSVEKPDKIPAAFTSLVSPEGSKPTVSPGGYFEITGNPAALDEHKPTVAFLEPAKQADPGALKFDGMTVSHADVNSIPAALSKFNSLVVRETLDATMADIDNLQQDHRSYFGPLLRDVATSIVTGSLPLGQGDVLNISMGNNVLRDEKHHPIKDSGDPTYTELNDKLKPYAKSIKGLKFPVTADNLIQNRDAILDGLGKLAKDGSDPRWQKIAQDAVSSNNSLKAIATMGVEVIHSAGNNGNDRVDLDFMYSKQIASVDPATHKPDRLSNFAKSMETDNGVLEVRRTAPGQYQIGNVPFTAADLCAVDAQNCGIHVTDAPQNLHVNEVPENRMELAGFYALQLGRTSFPQQDTPQGHLVAVAAGTSFTTDWLRANLDRLTKIKEREHKAQ